MNTTALNDTVLHHPALDDTVEYRVGRSQPVSPGEVRYQEEPAPAVHQCPGCRRRLALGMVWVAVVLLGIGAGAWLAGQWQEPALSVAEAGPSPSAPASSAPEKPKGSTAGAAQPVLPQDTQPSGPCDGAAGQLVAESNPVHLAPGETMGEVVIHHCGEGDVGWSALSKPYVSLEHTAGTLGEGTSLMLKFTVDPSGLPPGAYSFKIKVSRPGHNVYVTVHGSH